MEGSAAEGPAIEARAVEGPAVEARAVEGPAFEARAVEGPAVEARAMEGPAVEARATEGPAVEGPALQSPTLKLALLQSYQLISVCVCVCVCARVCERETLLYFFFFSCLDFISHIFKICSVAVLPVHFCVYMYMSVHVRVCGCLFCTPNILESHPLIAAHFFSDQFCSLYHQKIQRRSQV